MIKIIIIKNKKKTFQAYLEKKVLMLYTSPFITYIHMYIVWFFFFYNS